MNVQFSVHRFQHEVGAGAALSRRVLAWRRFDADYFSFQRDYLRLDGLPCHTRLVTPSTLSAGRGRDNTPQHCHRCDRC
jgi:hypothetical protein